MAKDFSIAFFRLDGVPRGPEVLWDGVVGLPVNVRVALGDEEASMAC